MTIIQYFINNKTVLVFSFIALCSNDCLSSHILGGSMVYAYAGNVSSSIQKYNFTLEIYTDCSNAQNSLFDFPAHISVYEKAQNGYELIDTVNVFPLSFSNVEETYFPCAQLPSNICVIKSEYGFEMELPLSNNSYFVSYQRCCRSALVSNVVNPDLTGATYYVELTPESQALKNSSPVFNNPPSTLFCLNEPLNISINAIDLDGDSLVYEFCPPYSGGGVLNDSLNTTSCYGIQPIPPCPPPYQPILFSSIYNPQNPFGGNPPVNINPFSGVISGTVTTSGRFTFGVCTKEYFITVHFLKLMVFHPDRTAA